MIYNDCLSDNLKNESQNIIDSDKLSQTVFSVILSPDLYIYFFSFLNKNEIISMRMVSKYYKTIVKLFGLSFINQLQTSMQNCCYHKNILKNKCNSCIIGYATLLCCENIEPILFVNKIIDDNILLKNYINNLIDLEKTEYIKKIHDIKKLNFATINKDHGCFLSDKNFQFISKCISMENIGSIHDINSYDVTFEFINNTFNSMNISLDVILCRFTVCFTNSEQYDINFLINKYSNEIIDIKNEFVNKLDNIYILLNFTKNKK